MFWIILYSVISIIVARYLEKHMKVAAIFHSILFVFLTTFLLFMSNNPFIDRALENIVGETYFEGFKESLFAKYRIYSSEFSVFIILEMILLFLSIIVLVVTATKVAKTVYEDMKQYKVIFKPMRIAKIQIKGTRHHARRIYLQFCRLLN